MSGNLSVTTKRIRELIDDSGLSRKELAEELSCDVSTIAKHYNGERAVNAEFIVKYAKRFNVSADYLLGLTETATTDKDTRVICDYTGLSEKAVEELHTLTEIYEYIDLSSKLKSAWICEGIRGYASVLNDFIEKGYLRVIIGLATDYYQSMDITIDMCNDLIPDLKEINKLNRDIKRADIHRWDILHLENILNNRKEIRLHYYEAQDIIRDFFRNHDKAIIKEYDSVTEEYDSVLYEYEKLIYEKEDGENNGDDQETQ